MEPPVVEHRGHGAVGECDDELRSEYVGSQDLGTRSRYGFADCNASRYSYTAGMSMRRRIVIIELETVACGSVDERSRLGSKARPKTKHQGGPRFCILHNIIVQRLNPGKG
jgi:hypothetical protein